VPSAETIRNKTNESSAGNSCLYDAAGNPIIFPAAYKSAPIDLSVTGTIVAAVPGKRIKVYAVKLVVTAGISVSFRDGGSTAIEGAQPYAANGGYVENVNPPAFLFGSTADNSLDMAIVGTGIAKGRVSYWDSDDA
jgi:hypothetical protein